MTVSSSPPVLPVTAFSQALGRTHFCGEVSPALVGQTITLNGWVAVTRDLGGIVFVELRDRSGLVQLVADPQKNPQAHAELSHIKNEAVISISGPISLRPADTINENHPTGTLEIYPESVTVLNRAKPLPFMLDEEADNVDESLRLKYRYLDLRRPSMFKKLELRHRLAQSVRTYLNNQQFLELETPILIRTTPEGARDYLVPSRVQAGQCFALPQSPQLFKQLFMMAGMERYYQIARCFRDEDLRADRQPEFTQIDIEMAFVTMEDVLNTIEGLAVALFAEAGVELKAPFARITWREAMELYGSDKPDLRFDLPFTTLTEVFLESDFAVFKAPATAKNGIVLGLRVPGAANYSRSELDNLQVDAKRMGAKGLAYILFTEEGPKSPILKYFSEAELAAVTEKTGAQVGDGLFFMADTSFVKACDVLGRFRLQFAQKHGLIQPNQHAITWVVDFPMFDVDETTGALSSCHHPFTAPHPDDVALLDSEPAKVRSLGYDLAYNGAEIGGGSIRIHQPELQDKLFGLIGLSPETAQSQFGFLVEALRYGAPPHGGIALGLDRIAAMLSGSASIRDVIAFPKNNQAQCLLTGAPAEPSAQQLKELHMRWQLPPAKTETSTPPKG